MNTKQKSEYTPNKGDLLVVCDKPGKGCGEQWHVNHTNTQSVNVGPGVTRYYVECPGCHLKYSVCYTNSKIRKLQKKMRELLRRPIDNELQIGILRNDIKAQMDALRKMYEEEENK
jgi:hypothetical protein